MGFITGLFGKIFGTDKALNSVVDGAVNGIDKLFYTDEEKAEDAAKAKQQAVQHILMWLETTKGQNLARRLIALSIVFTWLFQYWMAMMFNFAAIWVDTATKDQLVLSSDLFKESATDMIPAMMLILGFYFAAPHMGTMAKAALEKWGSKQSENSR